MIYLPGGKPIERWCIRNRASRVALCSGQNARKPPARTASFATDTPLMFHRKGVAQEFWLRWLQAQGFIERLPTLPNEKHRYKLINIPPEVDFVKVTVVGSEIEPFILSEMLAR